MSFTSNIEYIGNRILLELGVASFLAADAAIDDVTLQVLSPQIFDPAGGSCWFKDDLITYTGMSADSLTGIPTASDDGSILTEMKKYNNASPSLVHIAEEAALNEIELAINRTKQWCEPFELKQDIEKKRYWSQKKWFDMDSEIRDQTDASYTEVTPNTIDRENGIFLFTAAQTYSRLYVAGFRYNPFYAVADLYERIASDSRMATYFQIGQSAQSKMSFEKIALRFRSRGRVLEL